MHHAHTNRTDGYAAASDYFRTFAASERLTQACRSHHHPQEKRWLPDGCSARNDMPCHEDPEATGAAYARDPGAAVVQVHKMLPWPGVDLCMAYIDYLRRQHTD